MNAWARLPSPPQQPTNGPGSSDYLSRGTIYSRYTEQDIVYWIIIPDDPKPERAPVAVFFPDAGESDPGVYRGWLDHLTRRGFIVLYPVLPAQTGAESRDFAQNIKVVIDSAKQHLSQITTTTAAWNLLLFIGHGVGGVNAYNLACDEEIKTSTPPRALYIVQPYRETSGIRREPVELADAAKLAPGCSIILLSGADEDTASDADTREIGQILAAGLSSDHFASITIRSDRHGNPPLLADHYMAYAKLGDRGRLRIDTLDWIGIWKMADLLADRAFSEGKIVISDDELNMGKWSDALLVNTMVLNKSK
jgi:surfactin synthase thioesterase subunit